MRKKILLGLATAVVVVGGVAAMSAFEAHVINVTAKIENALSVPTEPIEFGTVFPQEYVIEDFTINLSGSFLEEDQLRMGDVQYKIVQKSKCICSEEGISKGICEEGEYASVNYWDEQCPQGFEEMNDLCGFLSKMCIECDNDTGVPSYYISQEDRCVDPGSHVAYGQLLKCHPAHVACQVGDLTDCWQVDLKVPPVAGSVGQDWPASCADWTVPVDGDVYGCDLWIEVTGFSPLETPPTSPNCADGWITPPEECESTADCLEPLTCIGCQCVE